MMSYLPKMKMKTSRKIEAIKDQGLHMKIANNVSAVFTICNLHKMSVHNHQEKNSAC